MAASAMNPSIVLVAPGLLEFAAVDAVATARHGVGDHSGREPARLRLGRQLQTSARIPYSTLPGGFQFRMRTIGADGCSTTASSRKRWPSGATR
jgi:hypothetical protein